MARFIPSHELAFGLKIVQRDPGTQEVVASRCQFCYYFGREEKPGAKRQRTENVKLFTTFRAGHYKQHLETQHAVIWSDYQKLSAGDKMIFFDKSVPREKTVAIHFEGEAPIRFKVKASIVNDIIGGMLFDPDDTEGLSFARALAVFEDTDDDDQLEVNLKSSSQFRLAVKFIRDGASFRQAAAFVKSTKEETNSALYVGCTEGKCATFVRVVVAANLQKLSDILSKCWTFSIAIDSGNKAGTNYLDVRVRFYHAGDVHNFHLLAVPMHYRKTAANIFNACVTLLDAILPSWRRRLIAFTSDGEPTMTGVVSGVATRFSETVEEPIFKIWCKLHQIDLVMQDKYCEFGQKDFVPTLCQLINYLRRQYNLQSEMKSTCPRFVNTRWASMKRVTSWLVEHKEKVLEYLEQKNPPGVGEARRPGPWWVLLCGLNLVASEVQVTVCYLQGKKVHLEQREKVKKLISNLKELCQVQEDEDGKLLCSDEEGERFTSNLGLWVANVLDGCNDDEKVKIYRSFGRLFTGLIEGIQSVLDADEEAGANLSDLPNLLPQALVKLSGADLTKLIRKNLVRLRDAGWDDKQIEGIEKDFLDLKRDYRDNEPTKVAIDAMTDEMPFFEAWRNFDRHSSLMEFSGGYTTLFPSTATVEADFSLVGGIKDCYKQSITDFSLEGCLQAKQFFELMKM